MLVGHQTVKERILKSEKTGRLSHAQLFLGPKHIGKTRLALELACVLQGAAEHGPLRKHVFEGTHPDTLLYLDEGERFPIKAVRDLQERVAQSHSSPYLVVVLENLSRLRLEASNALLKSLEEPRDGVLFFLTAHSESDVLPTIRSRCQVHYLQGVPDQEMEPLYDGHALKAMLQRFAPQKPGKLKRLMADRDYLDAHIEMFSKMELFLNQPSIHAAFELTRTLEKHPYLEEMLDILLLITRTFVLEDDTPTRLKHLDLVDALERIEQGKQDLSANVNKKLVLDHILLPFVP